MSRPACALAAALLVASLATAGSAQAASCPTPPPLTFSEPSYVDQERAGGEPMVMAHPDGTLLYSAHAGTTHFFTPEGGDEDTAAFFQNYHGQTYVWRSTDDGESWTFVERDPPDNMPMSGFSDPDFAIDADDNVFISEINLANVAMSKTSDSGQTFTLQNFFAMTMTDRQWSEADRADEVYLVGNAFAGGTVPSQPAGNVGHFLYKSKDGGKTFSPGVADEQEGSGLGDLKVDRRNGTLYEAHYDGEVLSIAAFRNARDDDLTPDVHTIATGVGMLSHWPAIDVDREGNVYIVWDESGRGDAKRAAGVYFSYSKDAGRTWAPAVRVDPTTNTDIWPWLAVGDPGRVAITWFEAEVALPNHDAQTKGEHGWNVKVAQTLSGLGCAESPAPAFSVSSATPEPFHHGTVCMGGTLCQAQLIDRRLGDYFTVAIDTKGMAMLSYSDTREGGSVALPAFARQTGGAPFIASAGTAGAQRSDDAEVLGSRTRPTPLPRTGNDDRGFVAGVLALAAASLLARRLARAR